MQGTVHEPVAVRDQRMEAARVALIRRRNVPAATHASSKESRPRQAANGIASVGVVICRLRMHELSIALALVELTSEEAQRLRAARVNALFVRLGTSSGVVAEALRFSFDLAAAGTIAEGARLELEPVDGDDLQLRAMEVIDGDAAADC